MEEMYKYFNKDNSNYFEIIKREEMVIPQMLFLWDIVIALVYVDILENR